MTPTATIDKTLDAWFASIAEANSDLPAIESVIDAHPYVLTYGVLNELVHRMSAQLDAAGVGPVVALAGHVHPATHAAYLAILRGGRTVVPVHPDEPTNRLREQLTILGAGHLVTIDAGPGSQTWESAGIHVLHCTLEGIESAANAHLPTHFGPSSPETIAYVLRTSGSTGRPKLVPISHASVTSALAHMIDRYDLGPGCRLSATFRLSFDVSVFDTFGALLSGGTLVLPLNREPLLPESYVSRGRLTHWCSVPSLAVLSESMGALRPRSMPGLRHTIFCGEPLRLSVALAWRHAAPDSVIDNAYGPTEMTIFCSDYRLPENIDDWPLSDNGTVPIGSVYPHLEHRISEEGELMLRGPQRFAGYVVNSDNRGRFWPEGDLGTPISHDAWYRTGDRVHVSPAGLVHLGRMDRQVKINGYRVELSEVEWHLEQQYAAQAAAVVIDHDGIQELLGVVARADGVASSLPPAATLPPHLRPSKVIFVRSIPLSANGKTDYAAVARLVKNDRFSNY